MEPIKTWEERREAWIAARPDVPEGPGGNEPFMHREISDLRAALAASRVPVAQDEREAFEAWARTNEGNCNDTDLRKYAADAPVRLIDGQEYIDQKTQRDWEVWQASAKIVGQTNQEPVAWRIHRSGKWCFAYSPDRHLCGNEAWEPLYTAPPAAAPADIAAYWEAIRQIPNIPDGVYRKIKRIMGQTASQKLQAPVEAAPAPAVAMNVVTACTSCYGSGIDVAGNPCPGGCIIRALAAQPAPAAQADDARDAARYRWLRDNMTFSTEKNSESEMSLARWLPAPEHNPHTDWVGERFEASVDRAVDAAIAAQKGES